MKEKKTVIILQEISKYKGADVPQKCHSQSSGRVITQDVLNKRDITTATPHNKDPRCTTPFQWAALGCHTLAQAR